MHICFSIFIQCLHTHTLFLWKVKIQTEKQNITRVNLFSILLIIFNLFTLLIFLTFCDHKTKWGFTECVSLIYYPIISL